jgi:hypothetical protein
MAIRGPRPDAPLPQPTPPLREQPASPLLRLMDFGAARTPQEALKLLKEILTLLSAAGFPVAKSGSPEQQASATLKEFQKQNGLPETGQLDRATFAALERAGLTPKSETRVDSLQSRNTDSAQSAPELRPDLQKLFGDRGLPKGGGEVPAGTQKTRTVETEQARARVDTQKPQVEVDLKSMLNSLRSAGFAGVGRGKEQLQDAVKKLQRADGLPPTGQLDAKTADALEKRGVIDAATAQALREQDPSYPSHAAATSTSTPQETSTPQSERAADHGGGGADGAAAGRGAGGGDGHSDVHGDGVVDHGDVDGDSDSFGNNYAGDDDDNDDRRGHANVDDRDLDNDVDGAFDHYEVKKLSQQIDESLLGITRDDDGSGAATYAWDVRLHRPGIYSARQPAEELLHLAVKSAGPFDPVWQQALSALNERLRRFEPGAAVVDAAALTRALQRARYR